MKLSKRLQAIYDMVNSPCLLADIGCDHALLPIALVQDGKCQKAYACDIHEGPLQRGREAIQKAQLQDQIIPLLSDGLQNVPDDITTIVIAGMGWETITSILARDLSKAQHCQQLIVQSNQHVEDLRCWVTTHGFAIDQETIVKEQHYYWILSLHPGEHKLGRNELLYGYHVKDHPLYLPYWKHILEKKLQILNQLPPHHEGYDKLVQEIQGIRELFQ